jgi:hypothetical protein
MEVNGRVMMNNSNHDLDSAYGLTMPNRLKFIATGPGLAAGIFCAISLDSNSAVSRIGETISQREDPYLAEIDYTLLAPARCSKNDFHFRLNDNLTQRVSVPNQLNLFPANCKRDCIGVAYSLNT